MLDLIIGTCLIALFYLGYSYYVVKKEDKEKLDKIGSDLRDFADQMNDQMRRDSESGKLWKDGIPRRLNPDGSPGEIINQKIIKLEYLDMYS